MKEFETTARIRLFDTDASGIAHYVMIQRFFEMGEQEALRPLNVKLGDPRRGGIHLPRVHVEITYHQPLYTDDCIRIVTACTRIGKTSLTWQQELCRGGTRCASGLVTAVLVDAHTHKPMVIPSRWRVALCPP